MAADEALTPDGSPQEYQLPQRDLLTVEEEKVYAAQIQQVVCGVIDHFEAMVLGMVEAVPAPFDRQEVQGVVRAGLRAGMICYLANAESPHTRFQKKAIDAVRDHLTTFSRGGPTSTPNDHDRLLLLFNDDHFDRYFPEMTLVTEILSKALRDLARPLEVMVEANMRLVRSLVRTHRGRGLDTEDLWQEGALGLREAALSFDPSQGAFSTLATRVVRNRLTSARGTAQGTKDHMARQVQEFRVEQVRLAHELNRSPTTDEVCGSLEWSERKRKNVRSVLRALDLRPLPTEREDSGGPSAIDREPGPASEVARQEEDDLVAAALARLTPEEYEVINLRYFLDVPSLAQVARELGLSESQVERRHKKAREKLERDLGKVIDAVPNKELA